MRPAPRINSSLAMTQANLNLEERSCALGAYVVAAHLWRRPQRAPVGGRLRAITGREQAEAAPLSEADYASAELRVLALMAAA
jgi:hypothetical protein